MSENPPSSPQWAAFVEELKREFPNEFSNKPLTLRQQLKDMDQIIAVEKNFIDNPDLGLSNDNEEGEVDESLHGIMIGATKEKLKKDLGRDPKDHEVEEELEKFVNDWKKEKGSKEEGGEKKEKEVDELLRFYDDDGVRGGTVLADETRAQKRLRGDEKTIFSEKDIDQSLPRVMKDAAKDIAKIFLKNTKKIQDFKSTVVSGGSSGVAGVTGVVPFRIKSNVGGGAGSK